MLALKRRIKTTVKAEPPNSAVAWSLSNSLPNKAQHKEEHPFLSVWQGAGWPGTWQGSASRASHQPGRAVSLRGRGRRCWGKDAHGDLIWVSMGPEGASNSNTSRVKGCGEGVKQMESCGPVRLRIRSNIASLIPIAWGQLGHISLERCF